MEQLKFDFEENNQPELPFEENFSNSKVLKEIDMKQCAKYCAVSYKFFLAKLKDKMILGMSSDGRYLPFKKYVDNRWFIQRGVMLERKGFRGIVQKVTVTPLGYKEIKKIINGK